MDDYAIYGLVYQDHDGRWRLHLLASNISRLINECQHNTQNTRLTPICAHRSSLYTGALQPPATSNRTPYLLHLLDVIHGWPDNGPLHRLWSQQWWCPQSVDVKRLATPYVTVREPDALQSAGYASGLTKVTSRHVRYVNMDASTAFACQHASTDLRRIEDCTSNSPNGRPALIPHHAPRKKPARKAEHCCQSALPNVLTKTQAKNEPPARPSSLNSFPVCSLCR